MLSESSYYRLYAMRRRYTVGISFGQHSRVVDNAAASLRRISNTRYILRSQFGDQTPMTAYHQQFNSTDLGFRRPSNP
jgi:hypothetical protein